MHDPKTLDLSSEQVVALGLVARAGVSLRIHTHGTDPELVAAAEELGIDLGDVDPAPTWIGVTVDAGWGRGHYLIGRDGTMRRPGGLGEPNWSVELRSAAGAELISAGPAPSADEIIETLESAGVDLGSDRERDVARDRRISTLRHLIHLIHESRGGPLGAVQRAQGEVDLAGYERELAELEESVDGRYRREWIGAQGMIVFADSISSGEAYDLTQTSDVIKSGHVLVVPSESLVGVMVAAWPCSVTADHGAFHRAVEPEIYRDELFEPAFAAAREVAAARGWELQPAVAEVAG